jgi:hypothetical protein
LYALFTFPSRAARPTNLIRLDLILLTLFGEELKFWRGYHKIFSILLLLFLFLMQIFSSALCYRKMYVLSLDHADMATFKQSRLGSTFLSMVAGRNVPYHVCYNKQLKKLSPKSRLTWWLTKNIGKST